MSLKPQVVRQSEAEEFYTEERCHILQVWDTEADPAVSIARARVEPGVTTVLHAVGVEERYVMVVGTGRVEVGDLPPQGVGPGDVVVIPRDVPQRITNTGAEDLIFYCVCTPKFRTECYTSLE